MLVTGIGAIRRNLGAFFQQLQLPLCESYGMVEAGSLTIAPPIQRNMARWESCSKA